MTDAASDPHALVRLRRIYHGRVQGVGFRYSTASIARRFPVVGFVRNRADGTVELRVAGTAADVEAFLAAVDDAFRGHVTDRDDAPDDSGETWTGFEIWR